MTSGYPDWLAGLREKGLEVWRDEDEFDVTATTWATAKSENVNLWRYGNSFIQVFIEGKVTTGTLHARCIMTGHKTIMTTSFTATTYTTNKSVPTLYATFGVHLSPNFTIDQILIQAYVEGGTTGAKIRKCYAVVGNPQSIGTQFLSALGNVVDPQIKAQLPAALSSSGNLKSSIEEPVDGSGNVKVFVVNPTKYPQRYTKLGSDCSGADKAASRVLTLPNVSLTSTESVFLEGRLLTPTTHYAVSHLSASSTITFVGKVFNVQRIEVLVFL